MSVLEAPSRGGRQNRQNKIKKSYVPWFPERNLSYVPRFPNERMWFMFLGYVTRFPDERNLRNLSYVTQFPDEHKSLYSSVSRDR
jgi:hypothetical protein